MTATREELAAIMAPVKHVLLDFDGPVCSVFASLPARDVAHQLGTHLTKLVDGPADWAEETDPFRVLRGVESECPYLLTEADNALTALEREAVASATPTPGASDFLQACHATGRTVSVVSNNAGCAISSYLIAHGLERYFTGIFGRQSGRPSTMKPSPHLLITAAAVAQMQTDRCVFVGDAVRDVEADNAASMPAIGYANKIGKDVSLTEARAAVVVNAMGELVGAIELQQ